ncbi:phosphoribosylamine--glycine ligase [Dongia sedimenti]|uniref:Phosphoribosylamine--glycine ligase n=1 Tax=Dongia sedimenti TaxID=3064282 RepID=A0ABU0YIU4_9PROT|nr:phosphoribosylamine--glycine ligase [Rhodospirillaceae bacterium R-7]
MRILVVGSGGREHALCWKIAASPLCDKLYCAPGNAGIAADAECVAIGAEDVAGITAFAKQAAIDFVVVGPEGPLVKGLADRLEAEGIATFGPSAQAAALEGSKGFMKDIAAKYAIPSARYARFTEPAPAKAFARTFTPPIVIKADGLASGKGVVICGSHAEAEAEIDAMLTEKKFGNASAEIVVEEFLEGEELSFFALTDGTHALPLVSAQDHKRVGDGDTGPNTGGMGAYSPAPVATKDVETAIMERIIRPTVAGMAAEGRPFKGVLFAGIMVTREGPKLIEYNVRFGDPETQVIMLRMKSDLLPALMAARDGTLQSFDLRWSDDTALVVVMAAKGYPEKPQTGTLIRNLDAAAKVDGATIFHAGTKRNAQGEIEASGGRVLGISATAKSFEEARARAYRAVDLIDWPGGFCRRDIGWRAAGRK